MKFCTTCVLPSTRPDSVFDAEGVCSACRGYAARPTVDWGARRVEIEAMLARHRRADRWDVVCPVSGGKDSCYQVLRMLEMGMHPLAVTASTCDPTEIGRRNLATLRSFGVDHIAFTPDPKVRARLNRLGLETVGDISWPEHCAIFTQPVQAAVAYNVPLICWGENSQSEYAGPAADAANPYLTRRWLSEFGGLLGLRVDDVPALVPEIKPHQLAAYRYPSDEDLARVGVTGFFLGHYLPWDGATNAVIAGAHGFESWPTACEGSLVGYENVDSSHTGLHDYLKFVKLGYGRATDQACLAIRRGRLTRADAARLVVEREGKWPATYLGKPLAEILAPLGLTVDEFRVIADRFTNKALFEVDANGNLRKNADGSPVRRYYP